MWRHVLCSDETKTELFGSRLKKYVWRSKSEAFKPENTVQTVVQPQSSIVLWGCFAASNAGVAQSG